MVNKTIFDNALEIFKNEAKKDKRIKDRLIFSDEIKNSFLGGRKIEIAQKGCFRFGFQAAEKSDREIIKKFMENLAKKFRIEFSKKGHKIGIYFYHNEPSTDCMIYAGRIR